MPAGLVMRLPQLPGTWARCLEGLAHPFTGDLRPITFDQKIAKARTMLFLLPESSVGSNELATAQKKKSGLSIQ